MNQYPLVYLDHVHKNYGDAPALYDVSLNIQPGRIIGLLGPNGSGKTTIIKLINGLLQPTSGHTTISKASNLLLIPKESFLSARYDLSKRQL